MSRIVGNLGVGVVEETKPSVFETIVTDVPIRGNRMTARIQNGSENFINDSVRSSHRVSFVYNKALHGQPDRFVYLELDGTKWKIVTAEFHRPNCIVTLGEVYNG